MNKHHLDILIESEVNEPKLTQSQIEWLNESIYGTWQYKNGVVNVEGSLYAVSINLTSIPVQFGKVTGDFAVNNNSLTSLKGCPHTVGKGFYCWNNKLTSLEYVPTKIGEKINCNGNQFILNDKLFEDLKRIGGEEKIHFYDEFIQSLYDQISIQFGVTDKDIIDKIFMSYLDILEGNK